MQAVLSSLAPTLATALFTVVAALIGLAADALRKKLKSERALNVLDKLEHLTTDVVIEAEQTTVADLKAVNTGPLTAEDGKQVAADVLAKLKTHLGAAGIKDAVAALGLPSESQLDSVLSSKIEATVASMPAAPPKT